MLTSPQLFSSHYKAAALSISSALISQLSQMLQMKPALGLRDLLPRLALACIFLSDAESPAYKCAISNAFFAQIVLDTDAVYGSFLELKGQTASENVAPEVRSFNPVVMVVNY